MLIDDSSFDLKIISRIVEHSGLFENILAFQGGREALAYIKDNLDAEARRPQLILLDIQMPEMDGFEFIDEFALLPSSFREKCRVAILSSTDDITDISRVKSNPHLITLIRKPLHPDVLAKLVEKYYETE